MARGFLIALIILVYAQDFAHGAPLDPHENLIRQIEIQLARDDLKAQQSMAKSTERILNVTKFQTGLAFLSLIFALISLRFSLKANTTANKTAQHALTAQHRPLLFVGKIGEAQCHIHPMSKNICFHLRLQNQLKIPAVDIKFEAYVIPHPTNSVINLTGELSKKRQLAAGNIPFREPEDLSSDPTLFKIRTPLCAYTIGQPLDWALIGAVHYKSPMLNETFQTGFAFWICNVVQKPCGLVFTAEEGCEKVDLLDAPHQTHMT